MFSKLSDHDFKKGVFRTKFSQLVTPLDKESERIGYQTVIKELFGMLMPTLKQVY
ncbi:hypothetical protein ACR9FV_08300 [Streptococcus dysgalactiae subsp. equisimilis]|uniref:hypothetical protein n=1 Tax=Streptococcus dysgalactiae TaxID=1334 RepID=UPI0003B0168C|nr:hypothetical protein [Streptococcus dysgalactiae]BAN92738.1 hypothetical protein SDSE167_0333 [Streptococcus dysgalactiae subsp. equisimilis 167]SLM21947.1 Uncharacterised protein [Streptococcus dysgalactiae subsp. equisimilis]SQE85136.1 Uncharacterised protein [Streptococcus dysgalactiae subsp. equisimilis]